MRVCVLSPSFEGSASVFKDIDPPCDPGYWMKDLPGYEFENHFIKKATAMLEVRSLIQANRFDVFINLCDGAWDEDRAGIEVVKTLETFKVPFTGASSDFYEPSKAVMKMVANYEAVKTPLYVFAHNALDVEDALATLKFKMIVKHFNGYGSIGMTKDSACSTADQLRSEASRFITTYGGALIEEFIEGREATVLVAENPDDVANPITFTPVECRFPPGETFKHFDLKWTGYEGIQWVPIDDPELAKKLKDMAARVFVGLKGVSYGRVDFRICATTGEPYFLEMNPNCGLFYPPETPGSADCILTHDPIGHGGFIQLIVRAALERQKRLAAAAPKCAVRYLPTHGYSLCATTDIKAGDLVMPFEERSQVLVSKGHVHRHWSDQKRTWFAQYAWPLSDGIYVMWADKPEDWRPLNHSCDPNTWFAEGGSLDVVARRDIAAREQVTMDYATFCADAMASFECNCGAASCRKTVRGTDYRDPAVRATYGTHMSDYVLTQGATP